MSITFGNINNGNKLPVLNSSIISYQVSDFLIHYFESRAQLGQIHYLQKRGYFNKNYSNKEVDDDITEFIEDFQEHEAYVNDINKKIDTFLKTHIPNYNYSEKYSFITFEYVLGHIAELHNIINKGEKIINGKDIKMLYVYLWEFKKYNNDRISQKYLQKNISFL